MNGPWSLSCAAVALALGGFTPTAHAQISAVSAVGMTVSDTVSEVEVFGEDYERLVGVFGARLQVVRMQ